MNIYMLLLLLMMMMSNRLVGGELTGKRCQDCGNQSKKNCVYMRCRTCCRRRGFECETHIKSTWIPVYRRHRRYHHHHHQHLLSVHQEQQQLQGQNAKRLRENPTSSAGLQMGNFPSEITCETTFRCVKVSSIDDDDDDGIDPTLAYQTAINVGGHIFKGILYYHHGPESCSNVGESSSSEPPRPPPQPYYPSNSATLTTAAAAAATATIASSAAAGTPYPASYTFPFGSYMSTGTQFCPQYPKS